MREFIMGMLLALPVFGIILLMFRDIIIRHFIQGAFIQKLDEVNEDADNDLKNAMLKRDVLEDILVSYRLLLTLSICLKTILKYNVLKDSEKRILTYNLTDINTSITGTEEFLDANNLTKAYESIKKDVFAKEELQNKEEEKQPVRLKKKDGDIY